MICNTGASSSGCTAKRLRSGIDDPPGGRRMTSGPLPRILGGVHPTVVRGGIRDRGAGFFLERLARMILVLLARFRL
jgi:hypothetical protein